MIDLSELDIEVPPLMPFADDPTDPYDHGTRLPIHRRHYVELLDQTGRIVVRGKRGRIDAALSPILERLGFSGDDWLQRSTAFRVHYRNGDLRRHVA